MYATDRDPCAHVDVGVVLLGGYLLLAYLGYRALLVLWTRRPDPVVAAGVVALIAIGAGLLILSDVTV